MKRKDGLNTRLTREVTKSEPKTPVGKGRKKKEKKKGKKKKKKKKKEKKPLI